MIINNGEENQQQPGWEGGYGPNQWSKGSSAYNKRIEKKMKNGNGVIFMVDGKGIPVDELGEKEN